MKIKWRTVVSLGKWQRNFFQSSDLVRRAPDLLAHSHDKGKKNFFMETYRVAKYTKFYLELFLLMGTDRVSKEANFT